MKGAIEHALASIWRRRCVPRILYYHSVHEEGRWSIRPELFRAHLRWLRCEGWACLLLREAASRLRDGTLPVRSVVITFDDGYEDNVVTAIPELVREGMKATFFLVSGQIGEHVASPPPGLRLFRDLRMMSRVQAREAMSAGMEIGSHTRSHVNMRELAERDHGAAADEVRRSKEELEAILGSEVTSFAYPNGQRGVISRTTGEIVRTAGFECAVTTMWGGLRSGTDLYELPRMEVRTSDDIGVLAKKMAGSYDFMIPYCRWVDRSKRWEG